MSSRHDEPERLGRLAGTGEGSGGGLPLPVLFSAILNEMLDNGPASTGHLTEITASTLEFKSSNVMTTWGSWEAFTNDVLEQMASREIISRNGDGLWDRGGKFRTGVPLVIIPAGRGRKADGVTIWPKDEREQLSKAHHAEREALSMVGRMRPVENQRVNAIRQSEPEVGQLYPVLVDQHGRILDGAHRLEANPGWRKHTIKVDSEEMALAVGLWANSGQPLPAKVRARITELIGDLAGTNAIKRARIEAELKRDASRSNREIAEIVGVGESGVLVGEVREELHESCNIHVFQFTAGRGRRPGKHSAVCWCGKGEEPPSPKPKAAPPSGPPAPRKVDDPALRAEIRRQLGTGVHGEDIGQSELCDLFGVGQYVAAQAVARETELFLREQLSSASALPAGDPAPSVPGPQPEQASPRPASPPPVQPEPSPASIDYADILSHLQAVANLEPDRIIADLEASGDHAMASEVYEWADRARDTAENLADLLEERDSAETRVSQ